MDRSTDWILIAVSLFLAILLSAISVPEVILWGSPEWVALVVFYCVITMPEKMGFTFAFILGLVLDTLQGTPVMGTHSLGLALIVWAGLMMGKRFFLMKMVQQIFVLFLFQYPLTIN